MVVSFTHDGPGTNAATWAADPRWAGVPALDQRLDLAPDRPTERLVVLAAHPDDESLGAGGLLARCHRQGVPVVVVCASDGEASHPASPTHTPAALAGVRRRELRAAVDAAAPGATLHLLGLPDGRVAEHEDALVTMLVDLLGDGEHTLLVAPWQHDGHPDHDASGRAASAAAARTGARLAQYPIWFWHWAEPDAAPWDRFATLDLDAGELRARAAAQAAHASQVGPLSDRSGDETLLGAELVAHFAGPREVFVLEPAVDTALDRLHASTPDPWGVDDRFYEARKRALLLAALPRARFGHAIEVGGSTGALAADLAGRCEDLLVLDASPSAVAAARERLGSLAHVRVEHAEVPREWPAAPAGGLDLVVVSEVGYFLSPAALRELLAAIGRDLSPDGVLVLCHWRHDVDGWPLDGPAVHEQALATGVRPLVARYTDRDVELLVLADPGCLPDPETSRSRDET